MRFWIFLTLLLIGFASTVEAKLIGSTVPYKHEDVDLAGYIAYDDSFAGKRPGVLIVHEWWGLNDYVRKRADQLAGMGYVAFAVDMYGKGKVTEHPEDAAGWAQQVRGDIDLWRKRAMAGLEVLRADPRTDIARIAAIGYCFGGSTVQQLAYAGAPLRGIVSFHGGLVKPSQEEAKAVKAKILICHGAADPFVKKDQIDAFVKALNDGGFDYQFITYSGAMHAFTNPEADGLARANGLQGIGYNAAADVRSWALMRSFFNEIFAR